MSDKKIKISEQTQEFLFYSYFGKTYANITKDISKEEAMKVCFKRAYRDFCRTLSFDKDGKKQNSGSMSFDDKIFDEDFGEGNLADMLNIIIKSSSQTDFDTKHKAICNQIVTKANGIPYLKIKDHNEKNFYFGQAQKWINMTLKYMVMIGLWNDEFEKVKQYLHVPLDNYIFKTIGTFVSNATWQSENKEPAKLVWSKIDAGVYKKIQELIVSNIDDECRYDWECRIWLEAVSSENKGYVA